MTPDKYDDVLVPFVSLMRRELHANCGKGDRPGWLRMDANTALLEVYYHLAKLQKAVRNNDGAAIQEYSADVANMAMMVLDICGGLAWVESSADGSGVQVDAEPDNIRTFLYALQERNAKDNGLFPQVASEVEADAKALRRVLDVLDFYHPPRTAGVQEVPRG